jgi:hypothetical protein
LVLFPSFSRYITSWAISATWPVEASRSRCYQPGSGIRLVVGWLPPMDRPDLTVDSIWPKKTHSRCRTSLQRASAASAANGGGRFYGTPEAKPTTAHGSNAGPRTPLSWLPVTRQKLASRCSVCCVCCALFQHSVGSASRSNAWNYLRRQQALCAQGL